ncbi:hypothetical protein [Acanthopleuribacter pedis]|uniref:Uncharacterized protein n=1 Tax=Acanthopleuribacter pedis TaxID=442870 RepID=A0A8J7QAH3_9BACT|nr:hypothetical protein [Acanthopleuribacter pedis]MBO1320469.1 hypothetical protein [Acanthopleuribacter pedis]
MPTLTLAFMLIAFQIPVEPSANPREPHRCEVSARDLHLVKRDLAAKGAQQRDIFNRSWSYVKKDVRALDHRLDQLEKNARMRDERLALIAENARVRKEHGLAFVLIGLVFWLVVWLAVERLKQRRFDPSSRHPATHLNTLPNALVPELDWLRHRHLVVIGSAPVEQLLTRFKALGFNHITAHQVTGDQPPSRDQVHAWEAVGCDVVVFDHLRPAWLTHYAKLSRYRAFAALSEEPIPTRDGTFFNTAAQELALVWRIIEVGRFLSLHQSRESSRAVG